MAVSPGDKRICIARIGAAHGVRGEVRLWSFATDPLAVANYGPLQSATGERFEITSLRVAKDCLVARFAGVNDRTAAEQLNNLELFVRRGQLPEPEDAEEYYHADLIGLTAVNDAGEVLGTVVAIQNFGAGDLIELKLPAGGETLLLPFTRAIVPVIDMASGRIIVNPPAGLLESDSDEQKR